MFLPKSKYSQAKHTPGSEFVLEGREYRGWYVKTFRNEYYTGKEITSESKKLIKITDDDNLGEVPLTSANLYTDTFTPEIVEPTARERGNTFFTRYFLQDKRSKKIIEVSLRKFNDFQNITYIASAKLKWILQGPSENLIINGYQYTGAEQKNREATQALETTIPGISSYIKDYSKFVE